MNAPTKGNPLEKLEADGMGMMPLTVTAAIVWTEWLLERLKADVREADSPTGAGVVWASQKTLAARYDEQIQLHPLPGFCHGGREGALHQASRRGAGRRHQVQC